MQGNLSHELFDRIFKVGEDLPNEKQIEALVETELADCIKKMAPFLMEDSWKVERDVLRSTLIKAVSKWNQVLTDLGAEIIKAEDWLQGRFSGIPIRGKTDQVIKLPDGKLIVVDFKKSKSGGRKKRMELGYDCQVSLYDIMLQHGDDTAGQDTGVLYFTLNDQVVLTDKDGSISDKVPSAKTIEEDVSVNALREIGESITSLRKGRVKMNYAGDAKQLSDHKGLSTFALDRSPLVNLFSVPGEDA